MDYYIRKIRVINDEQYSRTGKRPLVKCITFGCQMNAHDSERLAGQLLAMGYEMTDDEEAAGLIIYNTCCIRENAENRVYGHLGHLKHRRENGHAFTLVMCGCMTQQEHVLQRIIKTYSNVDIIFGTFNLHRFAKYLNQHKETGERVVDIWHEHSPDENEDVGSVLEFPHKSGVNIMYGCNNFCSYCVVPYVRGRERSRPSKDILNEIKGLADRGVSEIMLLGQNVNSYGGGLDEGINFPALLHKIAELPIKRIRFMTSHPKDLSKELMYALRDIPNLCKHLHLPVQSGSDRILGLMNRKYTRAHYLELLHMLRELVPGIAVTTDIIVGFPSETEQDFNDTLDLVRAAEFSGAFTFIYSKRTGTKAAEMDAQIPEAVAGERFNTLMETMAPIFLKKRQENIGKRLFVMTEQMNNGVYTGRTDDNTLVHFKSQRAFAPGEIANVRITDCKTYYLIGEGE